MSAHDGEMGIVGWEYDIEEARPLLTRSHSRSSLSGPSGSSLSVSESGSAGGMIAAALEGVGLGNWLIADGGQIDTEDWDGGYSSAKYQIEWDRPPLSEEEWKALFRRSPSNIWAPKTLDEVILQGMPAMVVGYLDNRARLTMRLVNKRWKGFCDSDDFVGILQRSSLRRRGINGQRRLERLNSMERLSSLIGLYLQMFFFFYSMAVAKRSPKGLGALYWLWATYMPVSWAALTCWQKQNEEVVLRRDLVGPILSVSLLAFAILIVAPNVEADARSFSRHTILNEWHVIFFIEWFAWFMPYAPRGLAWAYKAAFNFVYHRRCVKVGYPAFAEAHRLI